MTGSKPAALPLGYTPIVALSKVARSARASGERFRPFATNPVHGSRHLRAILRWPQARSRRPETCSLRYRSGALRQNSPTNQALSRPQGGGASPPTRSRCCPLRTESRVLSLAGNFVSIAGPETHPSWTPDRPGRVPDNTAPGSPLASGGRPTPSAQAARPPTNTGTSAPSCRPSACSEFLRQVQSPQAIQHQQRGCRIRTATAQPAADRNLLAHA